MPAPITLILYDPETQEQIKTYSQSFVPWKMLKRAIRLNKNIGSKEIDKYEETDIDELSSFVISIFGDGLTPEILDNQSDVTEMMTVIRAIVSRTRGVMDPTLPTKAWRRRAVNQKSLTIALIGFWILSVRL